MNPMLDPEIRRRIVQGLMIAASVAIYSALFRWIGPSSPAGWIDGATSILGGLALSILAVAPTLHREERFPADRGEWLWWTYGVLAMVTLLFDPYGVAHRWISFAVWLVPVVAYGELSLTVLCILSAAMSLNGPAVVLGAWSFLWIHSAFIPFAIMAVAPCAAMILFPLGRRFLLAVVLAIGVSYLWDWEERWMSAGIPPKIAVPAALVRQCRGSVYVSLYLAWITWRERRNAYWTTWFGLSLDLANRLLYMTVVLALS